MDPDPIPPSYFFLLNTQYSYVASYEAIISPLESREDSRGFKLIWTPYGQIRVVASPATPFCSLLPWRNVSSVTAPFPAPLGVVSSRIYPMKLPPPGFHCPPDSGGCSHSLLPFLLIWVRRMLPPCRTARRPPPWPTASVATVTQSFFNQKLE